MIQTIFLIILSVIATTFAFLFYIQKKKNIQILAQTLEFFILQEEQQKQTKTDKEQFNEDFLKFISDSRDWAYTYIEVTQEKVSSFISDVGPVIDYLEKYSPPTLAEDQRLAIIEGYRIIKTILPEDYGKIDT
jgi:uncharacterized membrane protein YraQ (UPF0718 family)